MDTIVDMVTSQTAETEEIFASLTEISSMIGSVSSNLEHTKLLSKETRELARVGGDKVSESLSGMIDIQNTVKNIEEKAHSLGESSTKVGQIVEIINGISEQTNLLALNAFQILEFDYGDAKLAGDYFSFLKDSKELREIEERKVIINDLKLFAQIQNRGIDAFITKDRKSLPKMIDPLKANKGLNFEFYDLTVPIKDVLGLLF